MRFTTPASRPARRGTYEASGTPGPAANAAVPALGMAIIGIGMCAVFGYVPIYLQMVYGKSAAVSCLLLFPMTAHL
jgi:hypothetical protein